MPGFLSEPGLFGVEDMRLCASYKLPQVMWSEIDEIRFSLQALVQAINFLENNKNKKVIIEILSLDDKISIDKIHDLLNEYPNLYFDFYDITDLLNTCNDKNKYMYHFPVNTYNMLNLLLSLPISDVTIGEPLTFDLDSLQAFIDNQDKKINIRVNPTLGRPELFNLISESDNGFNHFWILPQHMEFYDPYIDVLDLYDDNEVREQALVRVFRKGIYNRELKYFLKNCDTEVRGFFIDEEFIKRRVNCNQNCFRNRCHWCNTYEHLYHMLKDKQDMDNIENPFEKLQNK